VAQIETWIFQVQDGFQQLKYQLGVEKVAAPWQALTPTPFAGMLPPSPLPPPSVTPSPSATPPLQATYLPTGTPTLRPTQTPTPTATPWDPPAVQPLGDLKGEAVWQAYIEDGQGRAVAYRTFIQPDPQRPYALVAVVAFDLSRARLGFVLGFDEPSLKGGPKGSGLIPATDAQPGVLLATFNGGFKAEQGQYGAMSGGVVAIEPRKGLATVVIYPDGSLKMGEYGKDITSLEGALAWRQNCSLVIQNGRINPLVYNDSPVYWGAQLNGETATWRSGLGLSPDGKTLYYFAGPSLRMAVLAKAMRAVGVETGLQLDINNYWVSFSAIHFLDGIPTPEPLFPVEMKADAGRYLAKYPRDFFYVVLKAGPAP